MKNLAVKIMIFLVILGSPLMAEEGPKTGQSLLRLEYSGGIAYGPSYGLAAVTLGLNLQMLQHVDVGVKLSAFVPAASFQVYWGLSLWPLRFGYTIFGSGFAILPKSGPYDSMNSGYYAFFRGPYFQLDWIPIYIESNVFSFISSEGFTLFPFLRVTGVNLFDDRYYGRSSKTSDIFPLEIYGYLPSFEVGITLR